MTYKKVPVTYVVVNLQVEGIHNWPDVDAFVEGVSFLKHLHRHMFHIKATAKVEHDDIDKEIILMKREINNYLKRTYGNLTDDTRPLNFDHMSCEMIAKDLCEAFDLRSCEVLEDGENGAFVEIQNHQVFNHLIEHEGVNLTLKEVDNKIKIVKERDTYHGPDHE